jgi:prepilin-type N-terminal cleavage/methylation domain-containing protein
MLAVARTPRSLAARAFTLIELIAVIVVLAILSGVAIPKYLDYSNRSRTAAVQGSLGNVRSAIGNYFADQSINGAAAYPTLAQLTTVGAIMQDAFPKNPYNNMSTVMTATAAVAAARTTDGTTGWCYYVDNTLTPPVYTFYANCVNPTTATGGVGGAVIQNANQL